MRLLKWLLKKAFGRIPIASKLQLSDSCLVIQLVVSAKDPRTCGSIFISRDACKFHALYKKGWIARDRILEFRFDNQADRVVLQIIFLLDDGSRKTIDLAYVANDDFIKTIQDFVERNAHIRRSKSSNVLGQEGD